MTSADRPESRSLLRPSLVPSPRHGYDDQGNLIRDFPQLWFWLLLDTYLVVIAVQWLYLLLNHAERLSGGLLLGWGAMCVGWGAIYALMVAVIAAPLGWVLMVASAYHRLWFTAWMMFIPVVGESFAAYFILFR